MAEDDLFVLGDFGGIDSNSAGESTRVVGRSAYITGTERTRASGKKRFTFEIRSEPILVDLDPGRLGKLGADALVEGCRDELRNSMEWARPSTLEARKTAQRAFRGTSRNYVRGGQRNAKDWVRENYSGGRLGPMEPNQTVRKGIDSGRLMKSLTIRFSPRTGEYTLNVAANRFTPEFRARQELFLQWFVTNVIQPGIRSPRVDKAHSDALGISISTARDVRSEHRKRLLDSYRQLAEAGQSVADQAGEFEDGEGAEAE